MLQEGRTSPLLFGKSIGTVLGKKVSLTRFDRESPGSRMGSDTATSHAETKAIHERSCPPGDQRLDRSERDAADSG